MEDKMYSLFIMIIRVIAALSTLYLVIGVGKDLFELVFRADIEKFLTILIKIIVFFICIRIALGGLN